MNYTIYPGMSARLSLDPQADLVARLVELTAQVSMEPLPMGAIVNLHRKLDALEDSTRTIFNSTGDAARSQRQKDLDISLSSSREGVTVKPPSHSDSTALRSIWSQSLPPSAVTRPTTANTRPGSTKIGSAASNALKQHDALLIAEQRLEIAPGDSTSESEADLEACSKLMLEDLTALVGKLALRQEESRHINDLALAKAEAALKELAQARKNCARLEQSNLGMVASFDTLSSSMRYLKASISRVEARLETLVINIAKEEAEPASYATEAMSVIKRIERWRKDCASVENEVAQAKGVQWNS